MEKIVDQIKHPKALTVPHIRLCRVETGGRAYLFFRLPGEDKIYPEDACDFLPKGAFAACVFPSETADFSLRFPSGCKMTPDVLRAFSMFVFEGLGYPFGTYDVLVEKKRLSVTREGEKNDTGQGIYYEKVGKTTFLPTVFRVKGECGELSCYDYKTTVFYRLIEAEAPGRVNFHLLSGAIFSEKGEKPSDCPFSGAIACTVRRNEKGEFPFVFRPRFGESEPFVRTEAAAVVFLHLIRRGALAQGDHAILRSEKCSCFCRCSDDGQVEVGLLPDRIERGNGSLSVFFAKHKENSLLPLDESASL